MNYLRPLALGLALLLGLVAWRTLDRRDDPRPVPPQIIRPATAVVAPVLARGPEDPELGRVGSQVITAARLARWKSVLEIRTGEGSADGDAILLLEGALKREIAERVFGLRPSPDDLERTLRKMASTPDDAVALRRLEALFNGDRRAFLEEVVEPAFVEMELWSRFRTDPEIHRAARSSAELLASKAQLDPRQFASAGSPEATFGRGLIALSPGDAASLPKKNPLPRLDALPVDLGLLAQVPAGQIYPKVLDTSEAYVVLRVDRQRPGFTDVQTWSVPKVGYQTWLIERAREASPTLDDPALKAQVAALDPAHWLRQVYR